MILSEDNLAAYIKEHLADKMDFITDAEIQNVAMAGGGLVSAVFKAQVGGDNLYFKQAIPGRLDKVKELVGGDVPEDAFIVWNDGRQYAEVKALKLVADAVPEGFVPRVHYHDADNNIMVLSEVCGQNGVVLAEAMNTEINLKHAELLGANIAKIANHTFGKFEALRDEELEKKIKTVKYRYEVAEVWAKINDLNKKDQIVEKVFDFVTAALEMDRVLVHGDYHERNIIICGDRCGTYDLEECHWGDPVEDIGKLTTSYILRIIYFPQIRQVAYEAVLRLLASYFETLNIPETREALENRMKIMIAGCLLMRVDGISSMWLPWVHDEAKKENTRQLAVNLVLENPQYAIKDLLDQSKII
jgi:aminoglycoside phosphotransferase (APT) family kinase protein